MPLPIWKRGNRWLAWPDTKRKKVAQRPRANKGEREEEFCPEIAARFQQNRQAAQPKKPHLACNSALTATGLLHSDLLATVKFRTARLLGQTGTKRIPPVPQKKRLS